MDFSLLVGVTRKSFDVLRGEYRDSHAESLSEFRPKSMQSSDNEINVDLKDVYLRDKDGGMHAVMVHGPATYYFGLIDILQQWNWRKKLERFFKIFFLQNDGDGLSAIDPEQYAARFMERAVADVFDNLKINEEDDADRSLSPASASIRRGRVSLSRDRGSSIFRPSFNIAATQLALNGRDGQNSKNSQSNRLTVISSDGTSSRHADSWGKTIAHEV